MWIPCTLCVHDLPVTEWLKPWKWTLAKVRDASKQRRAVDILPLTVMLLLDKGFWLNRLWPCQTCAWFLAYLHLHNAVQRVIKQGNTHSGGLQTSFKQRISFDIESGEFVQMVAVSNSHWMTNSTTGCHPFHVCIYDSIIHKDVPTWTREQMAAFLCSN